MGNIGKETCVITTPVQEPGDSLPLFISPDHRLPIRQDRHWAQGTDGSSLKGEDRRPVEGFGTRRMVGSTRDVACESHAPSSANWFEVWRVDPGRFPISTQK